MLLVCVCLSHFSIFVLNNSVKDEKLSWSRIVGLDDVKLSLQQALEWPTIYPDAFTRLRVKVGIGVELETWKTERCS